MSGRSAACGSAPALGAEKFFPESPSRIMVSIVYNNLENLLFVQSQPKWPESCP